MSDITDFSSETLPTEPASTNAQDGRAKPRTQAQIAAMQKAQERRKELLALKRKEQAEAKAVAWAEKKKDQELAKMRRLYRDSLRRLEPVEEAGEVIEHLDTADLEQAPAPPPMTFHEPIKTDDLADKIVARLDENFFAKYRVNTPAPPPLAKSEPKPKPALPPNRPPQPPLSKYVFL